MRQRYHHHYSHAFIAKQAAQRPDGYLAEIEDAVVSRDAKGITYDVSHPAWIASAEKYADLRPQTLSTEEIQKLTAERGPGLWAELHRNTSPTVQWLCDWLARVPCGDCRAQAMAWIKENPPPLGDGFFEWAWRFHETVNLKLGKPPVSLEDARRTWTT